MSSESIRPEDCIITRKRKKYKFAKFALSPLCFEIDEWDKRSVDVVEVGAGDGLFSVELAAKYPKQSFLALDVKGDRLQKGAYKAQERGLTNVVFVRARADQIAELIPAYSLHAIWLTFPDPFPKKGSAGRRLTHETFLKLYERILVVGGSLHVKHDNLAFFQWSLEQLVASRWCIGQLAFNLHDTDDHDSARILTTYEKRWLSEGRTVSYCHAVSKVGAKSSPAAAA